jgi:hypothetical protein
MSPITKSLDAATGGTKDTLKVEMETRTEDGAVSRQQTLKAKPKITVYLIGTPIDAVKTNPSAKEDGLGGTEPPLEDTEMDTESLNLSMETAADVNSSAPIVSPEDTNISMEITPTSLVVNTSHQVGANSPQPARSELVQSGPDPGATAEEAEPTDLEHTPEETGENDGRG